MTATSKTRPRVVVTDYTFPDLSREQAAAERLGAEFIACQCKSAQDVTRAVAGATVAIVQFAPLTAAGIAGMAAGGGIVRYGIGYDNIDLPSAFGRGLPVGYVPDYCTDEVADHTASLVLASLRKLPQLDASVRAGDWAAVAVAKPAKPFAETVVGFLGLGRIGSLVLARLKPFGFRFLVADPQLDDARASALGATRVDVAALFRECDVLSLHAPATPETTHVVNAKNLATMKPGAVVVNTARGKLVDEAALADALMRGVVGGAALDVFETEPLPAEQELVAGDVARLLAGQPPRCPVPGSPA
jgi:D-3-phosphoglycerate dehydrogenase